jgi:hypothetical protein
VPEFKKRRTNFKFISRLNFPCCTHATSPPTFVPRRILWTFKTVSFGCWGLFSLITTSVSKLRPKLGSPLDGGDSRQTTRRGVGGLPRGRPPVVYKTKEEPKRHFCLRSHHEFKKLMLTKLASQKTLKDDLPRVYFALRTLGYTSLFVLPRVYFALRTSLFTHLHCRKPFPTKRPLRTPTASNFEMDRFTSSNPS